ncbi:MAG: phosphate uptake regulator PhoU [Desulfurococcaceae archaeon]
MKRYTRRVQFTGRSTYIVSLPKEWAIKHGLKPGSQVIVEETDYAVTIRPSLASTRELKRIVLSVGSEQEPETVVRWIIGAYVMGYDEIVVKSNSIHPQLRNAIRSIVLSRLPAAEITNEDVDEIRISVILAPDKQPFHTALKRLVKVVLSVFSDSCMVISRKDPEMAAEILREDDSIDRVYFYVNRLINMSALGRSEVTEDVSSLDLIMYRALSKLLERIGDHVVNIAKQVMELAAAQIPSEVHTLCFDVMNVYRKSTDAFLSKDPFLVQEVSSFVDRVKQLEKKLVEDYSQLLKPNELVSFKLLLESLRRIAEYSKDIAELALDMGLDKISATGEG